MLSALQIKYSIIPKNLTHIVLCYYNLTGIIFKYIIRGIKTNTAPAALVKPHAALVKPPATPTVLVKLPAVLVKPPVTHAIRGSIEAGGHIIKYQDNTFCCIEYIQVACCLKINDDDLKYISIKGINLRQIYICNSDNDITQIGLEYVIVNCKELRFIYIYDIYVNDEFLQKCKELNIECDYNYFSEV